MQKIEIIKKNIENKKYKEAEKSLNELLTADNKNYQYHLWLGYTLEKNFKFEKAIMSYINAKKLNKNETVINLLANIYIKINKYNDAIKELSESLKLNNKNPITLNNYGLLLVAKKNEMEGIKYFQKAISVDNNYMDAKYNLLEMLEKTNNNKLLEKVVTNEAKNFPKNNIIKFYEAINYNLMKKNKKALNILENINFKNHFNNWEFRRLNLLGKINDEIKNYKQAFVNYKSANQFLINNSFKKTFNESKYYSKLIKYNKLVIKIKNKKKNLIKKNNVPLFLIGFPRSGTTLLDSILSCHSKIEVIEEKPIIENITKNINDEDKINCTNINQKDLQKKYLFSLSNYIDKKKSPKKIIIDKMPLNLIYARIIKNIFPESKIIFCIRHPYDTILSCYFQNFILNEAMINFLDLKRTAEVYSLSMNLFNSYEEIQSKNIYKIKYENLVSNFDKELELLCNFIGINKETKMNEFYKNVSIRQRTRTASYNQINRPIYQNSKFKWLNYKKELKSILYIVEKWVKYYDYELK